MIYNLPKHLVDPMVQQQRIEGVSLQTLITKILTQYYTGVDYNTLTDTLQLTNTTRVVTNGTNGERKTVY